MGLSPDVDVTTGEVAAQTATLHAEHVAASGATLLEFATQDETTAAVRNGEADAAFTHTDFHAPFGNARGRWPQLLIRADIGSYIGVRLASASTRWPATSIW